MLLGNKCDIEAKRKVSRETGEKVRCAFVDPEQSGVTVREWKHHVKQQREWQIGEGLRVSLFFFFFFWCTHVYFR